ncbi:MAG: SGNH/GDSL hydrolase family protein [Pirellulales bacterium]|nr:SGNH/GDSL hydrolase family protein [Pirellulales bacterium]
MLSAGNMTLMSAHLILICILVIYPILVWALYRRVWVSGGRIRGLFLKLSLSLASLLYLFGGFEYYFYNHVAVSDGFGQTKMHDNWRARYGSLPNISLGLRDEEHIFSGRPALYVVGDSFTAGHGINNFQDRYANVLETLLQYQWDLILLAKGGWSTGKQIEVYSEISNQRDEQGGVLIWQYYLNDIEESGAALGITRPTIYLAAPRYLNSIVDHYHFANFLYWGVLRTAYAQEIGQQYLAYLQECYSNEMVWQHHRQQLQQVIELQHRGELNIVEETSSARKLIVIVYPNLKDIAATRSMSDKVADFFERQGVPVVNMADVLSGFSPKEITVNALDGHANEMVNRLLAEHLYKNFFPPK